MSAYPEDSISAVVADPARIASFARWSAEEVMNHLLRICHNPERYSDDAVRRRAEKDVVADVAGDTRLGFTHTAEEEAAYRRMYIDGYLATWRDRDLLRQMREQHAKRGFIIVCYR